MATFRIVSDKMALGSVGAVVDSADWPEINFEALVDGGHVEHAALAPAAKKSDKKEQD